MTRKRDLPDWALDAPFARPTALAGAIAAGRLRARDLERPFHGVRAHRALPHTLEWQCRAYGTRMPASQVFSHATAALLYGLPLPAYLVANGLHVTVPRGVRPPETRGIVGHQVDVSLWSTRSLVRSGGGGSQLFELRAVAPAIAWAQLACDLDLADLVALGDAVVAGEEPLATVQELELTAQQWRGRRGAASLTRALPLVRVGSWSRAESLHRQLVTAAGIPEPRLNITVHDRRGRPIARADEVWPEFRVLVEYEGEQHRSRGKFRSDITRFETYADADWAALRAHAADVFVDPNPFIGRLWRRLVARGWVPIRREPREVVGARY